MLRTDFHILRFKHHQAKHPGQGTGSSMAGSYPNVSASAAKAVGQAGPACCSLIGQTPSKGPVPGPALLQGWADQRALPKLGFWAAPVLIINCHFGSDSRGSNMTGLPQPRLLGRTSERQLQRPGSCPRPLWASTPGGKRGKNWRGPQGNCLEQDH